MPDSIDKLSQRLNDGTSYMGSKRFRIFTSNQAGTERIEVTLLDTTTMPLKQLIGLLATKIEEGLWMLPYRGIPARPGVSAFDVVLLDQDDRVLQVIAPYPQPHIEPVKPEPSSALILPLRSQSLLPVEAGDHVQCEPIQAG